MKNTGEKFKEIRQRRKLSQDQVAEKLNVSKAYISYVENNKKNPTIEFLSRAAHLFNVDVAEFVSEKLKAPEDLDLDGLKWVMFGEEMKKDGVTIDQIKEWVKAIKATNKDI
ncbi:helix-turn-helix domain-containing protein [Metabacillus idriensis]|uniref:helix-turn-helix domain-containing protein n=1 Tax=Metabacillus idriensis TaxID=324768 RepID=UPI00174A3E23|nr:helix-turn-helix transcriptional regulator [Metabacillus idriensis]